MLLRPDLLEPPDRCSRQSAGVLAEQRHQRLLEVAGGDALEVEDRDQHFEALRPPRVGRQKRRRKVNALRTLANTVAHARTAHGHWTDAGHDLALGQIPVSHQPLAPVRGQLVGIGTEQAQNLGLNSLRQQRSGAAGKTSVSGSEKVPGCENWKTLVSVTAYHSFSGEVEARTPPRYAALSPHAVTNFRP